MNNFFSSNLIEKKVVFFLLFIYLSESLSVFDQSQMDYVQNMDRDFDSDNLAMFSDWNDDEFEPTFLQTDTLITGLEDANLMEPFNSEIDLPSLPPTAVSTEFALIFLNF